MLPARRVELRAGEVVEAGPVGVAGHVEEPDAADEHVALVGGAVVERDGPDVAIVVPRRRLDRDAEAQVRTQPVLVDGLLEVLLQLGLLGVGAGPVVRLERVRVEVRADVDLGTRVRVVPPGAADAERRLVDGERVDAGVLHLHAGGDATEPGADDHDPWRARGSEQLLRGGTVTTLHGYLMNSSRLPSGSRDVDARGLDAERAAARHRTFLDDGAGAAEQRVRARRPMPSHRTQKSPHGGIAGRGAEGEVGARPHLVTVEVDHLVAEVHHHEVLESRRPPSPARGRTRPSRRSSRSGSETWSKPEIIRHGRERR